MLKNSVLKYFFQYFLSSKIPQYLRNAFSTFLLLHILFRLLPEILSEIYWEAVANKSFEVASLELLCASLIRKCLYKARTEKGDFPFKSNISTYIHMYVIKTIKWKKFKYFLLKNLLFQLKLWISEPIKWKSIQMYEKLCFVLRRFGLHSVSLGPISNANRGISVFINAFFSSLWDTNFINFTKEKRF